MRRFYGRRVNIHRGKTRGRLAYGQAHKRRYGQGYGYRAQHATKALCSDHKGVSEKANDIFSVKEEKRKNILLTAAEKEKKKEFSEVMEETKTELPKKEERQTEQNVDIELLMQKITKKLWEERESSGRRRR